MIETLRLKLRTKAHHEAKIEQIFSILSSFYNFCYDHCLSVKEQTGKFPSRDDLCRLATEHQERFDPDNLIYSQVFQETAERCYKAFKAYKDRIYEVKQGKRKKAGPPRRKLSGSYKSLTYKKTGVKLNCKNDLIFKAILSKIGSIKTFTSKALPKGANVKIHTLIRRADGYYLCITYEYDDVKKVMSKRHNPIYPYSDIQHKPSVTFDVGIDVGIKDFITISNGDKINCPNLEKEFIRLKNLKSKLRHKRNILKKLNKEPSTSRRVKTLNENIAKQYLKIVNIKKDYFNKVINFILANFNRIYIEELDINAMIDRSFSKNYTRKMLQASWSMFFRILQCKAEKADTVSVLKVLASWTSQICAYCLEPAPKDLNDRIHFCPCCNYEEDRDVNAAKNILHLGRDPRALDSAIEKLRNRKRHPVPEASLNTDSLRLSE